MVSGEFRKGEMVKMTMLIIFLHALSITVCLYCYTQAHLLIGSENTLTRLYKELFFPVDVEPKKEKNPDNVINFKKTRSERWKRH